MVETSNVTSLTGPFSQNLVMAFPRIMARAGSFAFVTVPERIDSIFGSRFGASMIAEATGNKTWNMSSVAISPSPIAIVSTPLVSELAAASEDVRQGSGLLNLLQFRNFGGIFTYMTSKWALSCFVLAIVLNRAQVYSAARRHIRLPWPVRLALRITPILLFLYHILNLLQAMRCQTSPNFSFLRYGTADKHMALDFSEDGGFMHWLSSTLLFWETTEDSCLAVDMIPSRSEPWDRKGSLSLLWPLFRSLCLGQFVETMSCAIQGRPLMTETGMSIFEHSLAFAEAEAMIASRLGLSWLGSANSAVTKIPPKEHTSGGTLFTRGEILDKMNTPPEVLLLCVISSLNSLSSQVLGVLGMQSRFRLINTGVWGSCFMLAFIWGFFSLRPESGPDAIFLRFPTVCIVGFIPHLLILFGILLCASIYGLALLLCFLSPVGHGQVPRSLSDRFRLARENLQANSQVAIVQLNMHEDFYTALLKIGFNALTVASEAVYLNEGQRVNVSGMTWLEDERLKELDSLAGSTDPSRRLGLQLEIPESGGVSDAKSNRPWKSGYDKQHNVKALKGFRVIDSRAGADGVGHMQRGGRYIMAAQYFRNIFWLWVSHVTVCTNRTLDMAGVVWRPQWLKVPKREDIPDRTAAEDQETIPDSLDFWMLSDDGILTSPKHNDIDVADEIRKRHQSRSKTWGKTQEKALDSDIYGWWRAGGWWGDRDESGSYESSPVDEDTISMISFSTTTSNTDDEGINSGGSTPTQRHPFPYSRISTPTPSFDTTDNALDPEYLAQLLDPQNKEARSEAAMLAHHLRAPKMTTRSQYRRAQTSATAKLLTSTRYRPLDSLVPIKGPLSPEEESQLLEEILIHRRAAQRGPSGQYHQQGGRDQWQDGGVTQEGGPQCVVCQSAPRTILAWPCRCLSLCEECRIQLAMNNFGTCVCCRQDVVGFSRLYVP